MSIKYGTTDVNDVKINQNGTLVQVNKIVKDGITLWQKNSKTTGGVWRGVYGYPQKEIELQWQNNKSRWTNGSEVLKYIDELWRFSDGLDYVHMDGDGSEKHLTDYYFYLDITWSAT